LPIHRSSSSAVAAAGHTAVTARGAAQRGYIGRHLVNRNEMRVYGSDSYALLFLLKTAKTWNTELLSNMHF